MAFYLTLMCLTLEVCHQVKQNTDKKNQKIKKKMQLDKFSKFFSLPLYLRTLVNPH